MKRESVYPFTNFDPPGATIHVLRTRNGWTLAELSERCGVSLSALSRIENGACGWTRASLEKIAAALGVRLNLLFFPPELIDWYAAPKSLQNQVSTTLTAARTEKIARCVNH